MEIGFDEKHWIDRLLMNTLSAPDYSKGDERLAPTKKFLPVG